MKRLEELEREACQLRDTLQKISLLASETKHGFKEGEKITVEGKHATVSYEVHELGYPAFSMRYRLITKDGKVSSNVRHVYSKDEKIVPGWV